MRISAGASVLQVPPAARGTRFRRRLLEALPVPRRQRHALRELAHRPWPIPTGPWILAQSWERQLFAHWPVSPRLLEPVVPPQIPLDLFEGRAWISVTPFEVTGLRTRGLPPPPVFSRFPEINVRTYAVVGGRPGVYFFSLDAASSMAVAIARRAYRLPYHRARMAVHEEDGWIVYRSQRVSRDGPDARFEGRYRPVGQPRSAAPGSLGDWLAERYCLYTLDSEQRIMRGDIHHPPWPLQEAELEISSNTMGSQIGLELDGEPFLQYARRQDVLFWPLRPA